MNKFKGLKKATQELNYGRMADELRYRNADDKKEETPYYKQTRGRAKAHVATLKALQDEKDLAEMIKQGINL